MNSLNENKSNESYFDFRLKQAGLSKEQIRMPIQFFDEAVPREVTLFSEDKSGNILIRYFDLNGEQVYYEQKGKLKEFFRTRLKEPIGDMKYFQPKGTEIHMYWTPSILEKFRNKENIKTLFITEGEIKAFVGSQKGIDIAGIGGIHNFSDKNTNTLLPELEKLISVCDVKNLVLLFDADCLTIKYEENKDLYTRPNSFYSAVKKFKELSSPLNTDVYFSHILSKHKESAKGLDDLINHSENNNKELISELYLLSSGNNKKYFHTISISANSISLLRKYFGIDTVNRFYLKHAKVLQESPFTFKGHQYQHDGDKLRILRHKDADLYVRIACEYFKKVSRINSRGDIESNLKKWKISEIKRDYYNSFIDEVQKYDEFCNIPDNTESYQRVFNLNDGISNYNLFEPLNHELIEGDFTNTKAFLKHLFRSKTDTFTNTSEANTTTTTNAAVGNVLKEGDPYLIALDYLTILYQKPQQLLPILCLVSKEQGTGKSTFLKWLKAIFKSNATILGNSEFKMEFNTHYISKLLIMIDESFIELDKKSEKERIKKLATSTKQFYHPKGIDTTEIDYFGKLIMCSNSENNFISLEKSDIRFFVVKVYPFEKEDPDFLEKLIEEIPCFLYHLKHRKIFHPKTTRAWFSTEHLVTNQFREILRHTRSRLENDLREYVQETILTHSLESLKIDATRLTKAINEQSKYKHSVAEVRAFLKTECDMIPQKTQRYKIPTPFLDYLDNSNLTVQWQNANGRPYEFLKSDWVEDDEMEEDHEISEVFKP